MVSIMVYMSFIIYWFSLDISYFMVKYMFNCIIYTIYARDLFNFFKVYKPFIKKLLYACFLFVRCLIYYICFVINLTDWICLKPVRIYTFQLSYLTHTSIMLLYLCYSSLFVLFGLISAFMNAKRVTMYFRGLRWWKFLF